MTNEQIDALQEKLEQALGTEEMLHALCKALGYWKLEEYLTFIARCYDIPYGDEVEVE